jgi:hypothetical protein
MTGFAWSTRSHEERALLNPAYGGQLLLAAAGEYGDAGLPFPLSFLVLPLVLHKKTREALPTTIRTSVPMWLQRNPDVKVGFDERVAKTVPITREAIAFLMRHQKVEVLPGGMLRVRDPLKASKDPGSDEIKQSLLKARFFGRWIQRAGTPATVFALFGIRP